MEPTLLNYIIIITMIIQSPEAFHKWSTLNPTAKPQAYIVSDTDTLLFSFLRYTVTIRTVYHERPSGDGVGWGARDARVRHNRQRKC